MIESNRESAPQPRQPKESSQLAERITNYLTETNPIQEGFLDRKEWKKELEKSLNSDKNILVVFSDIAGAGKLGKKIDNKVKKLVSQIDSWQEERITQGRQVEARRRQLGSDEFLIFSEIANQNETQQAIEELNNNFNRGYEQNQVHLGAAFVPGNSQTTVSEALRGADIALSKAKEANKSPEKEKKSNPKLLLFNPGIATESPPATLNDKPIAQSQFVIEQTDFSEEVVQENAVAQLRTSSGTITALTPAHMKRINKERGMTGGDTVLKEVAEKAVITLKENINEREPVEIFKIGPIFALRGQLTSEQLQKVDQLTPYGIEWAEVEVS